MDAYACGLSQNIHNSGLSNTIRWAFIVKVKVTSAVREVQASQVLYTHVYTEVSLATCKYIPYSGKFSRGKIFAVFAD